MATSMRSILSFSSRKIVAFGAQPETIDALKDNIREAIDEYSCTQSIMCLQIAWPSEAAIRMKLFSIINRKDCTFK